MTEETAKSEAPPSADDATEEKGGWSLVRWTFIASGVLAGIIILILIVGLGLAIIGDPDDIAPRVQLIRDVFIIVVALEFILIIFALTALVLQIAQLINLLQNEIKPILKNTQDTVNTAKGTAQFVGANVVQPVMRASALMASIAVFLREIGGIRRAIRPGKDGEKKGGSDEAKG